MYDILTSACASSLARFLMAACCSFSSFDSTTRFSFSSFGAAAACSLTADGFISGVYIAEFICRVVRPPFHPTPGPPEVASNFFSPDFRGVWVVRGGGEEFRLGRRLLLLTPILLALTRTDKVWFAAVWIALGYIRRTQFELN